MAPLFADLFAIAIGSSEPIYRQLVEQVRRRVASGYLKAGDEIPSVRQLARALAIHPMTVSKAFGLLEADGVLERRRGLAMVVAQQHHQPQAAHARAELLRPSLKRAAHEARELKLPAMHALALFKQMLRET